MDFYRTWQNNKRTNCDCDWCCGNFRCILPNPLGKRDWSKVEWGLNARDHIMGTPISEDEAMCCKLYIKTGTMKTVTVASNKVYNCKRCNNRNSYAEANQSDGTYLCYECR